MYILESKNKSLSRPDCGLIWPGFWYQMAFKISLCIPWYKIGFSTARLYLIKPCY